MTSDIPILVLTMGKTGTQSLIRSLQAQGYPAYKAHELKRQRVLKELAEAKRQSRGVLTKSSELDFIDTVLPRHNHIRVITTVREILGRAVSGYFQRLPRLLDQEEIENCKVESLIAGFFETYNPQRPKNWFDWVFSVVSNRKLEDLAFDPKQGYAVFREGKFEILLLQIELNDERIAEILADTFGLEVDFELRNMGENRKMVGDLYRQFKDSVVFPFEFLDQEIDKNPYMRKFYSAEQRQHFIDFYIGKVDSLAPIPR